MILRDGKVVKSIFDTYLSRPVSEYSLLSDSDRNFDLTESCSSDNGETHVLKTLSNAIHTLNNIRELSEKTISDTNFNSRKNSFLIESLSREIVLIRNEKSTITSIGRKFMRGFGNLLQVSILHIIMFLASIFTIFRFTYKSVSKLFKSKKVMDATTGKMIKLTNKSLYTRRYFRPFYVLNTLAVLFIFWCLFSSNQRQVYDLKQLGIVNTDKVQLPSTRIAAWHIAPGHLINLPFSDILKNGLPIVLYLRGSRDFDSPYGLSILKNLAINKYNILAPVSALERINVIDTWSSLQKRSNGKVYAWFGKTDLKVIKKYANAMCEIGVPPHGIIMETKHIDSSGYHNLEVWSTQCNTESNILRRFKFVKCPLTENTQNKNVMQDEISECFEELNRHR